MGKRTESNIIYTISYVFLCVIIAVSAWLWLSAKAAIMFLVFSVPGLIISLIAKDIADTYERHIGDKSE